MPEDPERVGLIEKIIGSLCAAHDGEMHAMHALQTALSARELFNFSAEQLNDTLLVTEKVQKAAEATRQKRLEELQKFRECERALKIREEDGFSQVFNQAEDLKNPTVDSSYYDIPTGMFHAAVIEHRCRYEGTRTRILDETIHAQALARFTSSPTSLDYALAPIAKLEAAIQAIPPMRNDIRVGINCLLEILNSTLRTMSSRKKHDLPIDQHLQLACEVRSYLIALVQCLLEKEDIFEEDLAWLLQFYSDVAKALSAQCDSYAEMPLPNFLLIEDEQEEPMYLASGSDLDLALPHPSDPHQLANYIVESVVHDMAAEAESLRKRVRMTHTLTQSICVEQVSARSG
jgi:hypothetical protein